MITEKEKIELVKALTEMFTKYNLKEINCSIYTSHPMKDGKIINKDLLHLKIKDNHDFKLEDTYFDTLEDRICLK